MKILWCVSMSAQYPLHACLAYVHNAMWLVVSFTTQQVGV